MEIIRGLEDEGLEVIRLRRIRVNTVSSATDMMVADGVAEYKRICKAMADWAEGDRTNQTIEISAQDELRNEVLCTFLVNELRLVFCFMPPSELMVARATVAPARRPS